MGQRSSETGTEQGSTKLGSPASVHDVVLNVEISSQHDMGNNEQPGLGHQSPDSHGLKKAKMGISPWSLEHQRYFTLTFTSFVDSSLSSTPAQPPGMSQVEHQGASSEIPAPMLSSPTSSLGDHSRDSSTGTPCSSTEHAPVVALAADLGGLSISHEITPSAGLERLMRMKDAIIDSMETPVVAMCHDESLAIANKAALSLMRQETDSASSAPWDLLARFKIYTDDFERELELKEHPIVRICRSQKSFEKLKIGILDSKSQRKRFDVSGETIFDERTGEFFAGIIFLKDITGYAEIVPNQFEAGQQQQFQVICDTIPQMVWLVEVDRVKAFS